MTEAVLDTPAEVTPTPAARPSRLLSAAPWLIAVVTTVAVLVATGTPPVDILRYAAYFAVAVLLPGTLVHRALRGSRGNLPEDLGLGGATGLVLLLAGWALAAATGLQVLLPGWPLLIIALFLAVPRLRRHWRIADPQPLPATWSWAVAVAIALAVLSLAPTWRSTPLPPADASWYQDLGYHLALVREMMRSMPFQVPELAGDTLHYHFLSDADMATAAMITKIDPATVLLRLWLPPIIALTALVAAALARQLAGKWRAGALAGLLAVAGLPLVLGSPIVALGGTSITYFSPSECYQLPLVGLLLAIAADVLRGRPLGWAWALVFPLGVAITGAKSSGLPPVVAGLAAAGIAIVLWHRERLRATLALFGLLLVAMLVGYQAFAGGGAGTLTVQPLSIVYSLLPYRETLGANDLNDGRMPLGIANASASGLVFVAALIGWWLLVQIGRLAGLALLVVGRARRDPAAWLLAGVTVAGLGGMWLFWHPSGSQSYFWIGVLPFATILSIWLLADRAPGPRAVIGGLAAGAVWAVAAPKFAAPAAHSTARAWSRVLLEPVLLTAGVAVVVVAVALVVRRGPGARRALPAALLAAVLGAGFGGFVARMAPHLPHALDGAKSRANPSVTRDEMAAAQWLDKHAGADDVLATNVHCQRSSPKGTCDARAFWVSALTGRRALVESWAYTDQAVAANGVNGLRYYNQPAPYPERYALNERVFAEGDPADVAALRTRYHVRWLFADSRVGPISPRLAQSAVLRHADGPVSIYELVDTPQ
ncbi:hypothetical protein ODJ79_38990 [Actinoplanes sp. KI2]|uniref:hypothetical protein n=1 Tax=Actinoplanes sp. KI2 TaxID=2983315 RepID=UPI0021D5EE7A|nr:hypothetical protein [Actinoplanes sp. KI2]MCU7729740.1 hypothetical protein [Actinoplanes sp. KI2]